MTEGKFLKIIYWILFFGLCGLSMHFTREVFEKFSSKDTSFKISKEHIQEHPTITICFTENYEYGQDFNISHSYMGQKIKYGNIEKIFLTKGKNHFNVSNEIIYLKKLVTFYSGICYKIVPTGKNIDKGEMKAIQIYFDKKIPRKNCHL